MSLSRPRSDNSRSNNRNNINDGSNNNQNNSMNASASTSSLSRSNSRSRSAANYNTNNNISGNNISYSNGPDGLQQTQSGLSVHRFDESVAVIPPSEDVRMVAPALKAASATGRSTNAPNASSTARSVDDRIPVSSSGVARRPATGSQNSSAVRQPEAVDAGNVGYPVAPVPAPEHLQYSSQPPQPQYQNGGPQGMPYGFQPYFVPPQFQPQDPQFAPPPMQWSGQQNTPDQNGEQGNPGALYGQVPFNPYMNGQYGYGYGFQPAPYEHQPQFQEQYYAEQYQQQQQQQLQGQENFQQRFGTIKSASQKSYRAPWEEDYGPGGELTSNAPLQNRNNEFEMGPVANQKSRHRLGDSARLFSLPPRYQALVDRYLLCCCPKNRKHRMICCAVVVVVLIVLGVIAYVYIPRYPQIKVYSINLSNFGSTNTPYSFTVADSSNPDYNTLRFRMNLTMNLGTYNPNPYDFDVTEIDLSALMMVNKSVITNALLTTPLSSFSTLVDLIPPPANHTTACTNPSYSPQIGTASHGAVVFPAKQTVNYTMLFLLDYSPDPNCGLLYDPTINEIASACGITSRDESQRPMDIRYNAQSTISSLQSLGFTPTISGDIHINCPFSNTSIKAVVADVESGMSIMAAIESVFGGSSASSSVTLTDGGSSGSSSSSGGSSSGSTTSISSGGNNSGDAVTTTAQANGDSNGGATTTTTATDNGGAVDTALASTVQTVASDGAGNGAATSTIADVGGGGATSTTNIIGVQPTSATTDAAAGAGV